MIAAMNTIGPDFHSFSALLLGRAGGAETSERETCATALVDQQRPGWQSNIAPTLLIGKT
jgi:hypothetical protein